jgi:DNA-binding MurR/RpiR family transcriptional regulator
MTKIKSRIESLTSHLTPSDKLIARALKKNFDEIPFLTIHEFAKKIDLSATTISRFVKKIGYDNFVDFKYDIIKDIPTGFQEIYEPIAYGDNQEDVINKVFGTYIESLKNTQELLNYGDLIALAKLTARVKRILFIGIGGSGCVAQYAAYRFSHLNLQAEAYDNDYQILIQTMRVTENDVVVGISHSGQTKIVINGLAKSKELKATTVGISNYIIPQMRRNCDFFLCTSFKENRVKAAALSSLNIQICIVDLMYLLVAMNKRNLWDIGAVNNIIDKELRIKIKS